MVNMISAIQSRNIMLDAIVAPKSGVKTFFEVILSNFVNLIVYIYELLVRLIYLVCEFIMAMIDFIFVFIRQLIGVNDFDFTKSDLSHLGESDLIMRFMYNPVVTRVLRGIIVVSIVLIILFSIIAIIRSEYLAATTNANNSKNQIFAGALKSIILMALVPVLMIGSMFISNAILKSLYLATSGGEDVSMGSQIFIASAYQANQYRLYAENDYKIPITYNFSKGSIEESDLSWASDGTIEEMEEAFQAFRNSSAWNRGYTTYAMFINKTFVSYDDVETADELERKAAGTTFDYLTRKGSSYHLVYDEGLFNKKVEYNQMAEVVDYAIKSRITLYFKTPQDIASQEDVVVSEFKSIDSGVSFTITYKNPSIEGGEETVTYYSKNTKGVQDEAKGSTFLVCKKETIKIGSGTSEITKDVFVPLRAGVDFASNYTKDTEGGQLVVARGVFDEGGEPTAIRELTNGKIECYRDKINFPYLVDFIPKISYELPEGTTEQLGLKLIKSGVRLLTGIDPNDYIPYVYYNFDIFNLFSKVSRTVASYDSGEFYLDYTFSSKGVVFQNFYSYKNVNIIVLVFCSILIVGILFKAVFGVAARIFDIILLYLMYPAVCATIVMDDGARFKNWVQEFTGALLSVYGIVIGINIVLIFFPIIDGIEVFTAQDFVEIPMLKSLPSSWTVTFVNFLLKMMFTFVSFSLLKTIVQTVSSIMGTGGEDVIKRGDEAMSQTKKIVNTVKDVVSGQVIVNAVKNAKNEALGFIPANAIVHDIAENNKFKRRQGELANAKNELGASIKSGNVGQIQAKTAKAESVTSKSPK